MGEPIGIVLSGSTTRRATIQLYEKYEGKIHEGELCIINSSNRKLLCRVDKIVPFSEFLEKDDAFTEARRKRANIPSQIARKYYNLELEILNEIRNNRLVEVTLPPSPGDEVFKATKDEILAVINQSNEERLLIEFGTLFGYKDIPLYLNVDAIPMHLAIVGVTGSGKSYTVGYLIEQLSELTIGDKRTALSTIIIDANGDYLDYYDAYHLKGKHIGNYTDIIRFVFNKSSRALFGHSGSIKVISLDLDVFNARELSELIMTYYSGGSLNELQVSGLDLVLRNLEGAGYSFSMLFTDNYYDKILQKLDDARRKRIIHDQTYSAIRRALAKFKEDLGVYDLIKPKNKASFNDNFVNELINPEKPKLVIIDFSADGAPGVPLQLKQLIVAYITKLLFKKFTEYKSKGENKVLLLIIEEAQNYCPNQETFPIGYSLARENLAQIATQGRKFGLSLCLVSQRPSFVDQVVLSMVNTFIIHRVSAADVTFIKRVTGGLPEAIENKLTNLATGKAIVTGQMNVLSFPILVDIPERKIKPTVGKISVSEILKGK